MDLSIDFKIGIRSSKEGVKAIAPLYTLSAHLSHRSTGQNHSKIPYSRAQHVGLSRLNPQPLNYESHVVSIHCAHVPTDTITIVKMKSMFWILLS